MARKGQVPASDQIIEIAFVRFRHGANGRAAIDLIGKNHASNARRISPLTASCPPAGAPQASRMHRPSTGKSQLAHSIGGSAHNPRRRCAEPSQASALVDTDRLKSIMATMRRFGNGTAATGSNYLAASPAEHDGPDSRYTLSRITL